MKYYTSFKKKKEIYRKKNRPYKHKKLMKIIFRKKHLLFLYQKFKFQKRENFQSIYPSIGKHSQPVIIFLALHISFFTLLFSSSFHFSPKNNKNKYTKQKKEPRPFFLFHILDSSFFPSLFS